MVFLNVTSYTGTLRFNQCRVRLSAPAFKITLLSRVFKKKFTTLSVRGPVVDRIFPPLNKSLAGNFFSSIDESRVLTRRRVLSSFFQIDRDARRIPRTSILLEKKRLSENNEFANDFTGL